MINFHAACGEHVECIFMSCAKSFTNPKSLKSHFSLKHEKLKNTVLKSQYTVNAAVDVIEMEVIANIDLSENIGDSIVDGTDLYGDTGSYDDNSTEACGVD